MEFPTPSHLMILSTLFLVLIFLSSMVTATSPVEESICRTTAEISPEPTAYDDCIYVFSLDPHSEKADLEEIARIALILGQSNTTDSRNFIQNLISQQTDPSVIESLKNCWSLYDAAKDSFRWALAVVEENPVTANNYAKMPLEDADKCDQELSKLKNNIPSVTTKNKYLKLYSYIGDVVTDYLI